MKFTQYIGLAGMVLLAAACTQQAAPVDYRGSQFYGRDQAIDGPHETYAPDSPRYKDGYTRPVEPAGVPAVGISDLAPIGTTRSAPAGSQPVQPQANAFTSPPQSAAFTSTPLPPPAPAPQSAAPVAAVPPSAHNLFIWPVSGGRVIAHFGLKPDGTSNDGINIAVAEGEPIYAAAGGTVVYGGNELKGYGNMIILRHDGGWMTAYAHTRSISVKKGDKVKQGDVIAYVGMTGGVKAPQLHFAMREGKTPVDPEKNLPQN